MNKETLRQVKAQLDTAIELLKKTLYMVEEAAEPPCPACVEHRLHSEEEFKRWHPSAGSGHHNTG